MVLRCADCQWHGEYTEAEFDFGDKFEVNFLCPKCGSGYLSILKITWDDRDQFRYIDPAINKVFSQWEESYKSSFGSDMKQLDIDDTCPKCGHKFECIDSLKGDGIPKPGDLSLCSKCAAILEFDDSMKHQLFRGDPPPKALEYQRLLLRLLGIPQSELS